MKDVLKLLLVIFCAGLGAAIPLTGFYLFWSWAMAEIGTTIAYAGLIKVGVTICLLVGGGWATVVGASLGCAAAGTLAVALTE